jgi:1-deoxy-D-xylulose-5-phosphate synthase
MPENSSQYKYLYKIDSPADLKKLQVSELDDYCKEIRTFLIENIFKTGGHFGAGLGVVELTVAMHYVMDTPKDKIIFDTGHQGYPHKIITGRRDKLHTIRQKGGISGFLKPTESHYDAFGAGHASTSISAALGIAAARDLLGEKYSVLAVIGDGALTGGLAFEAMNNCGYQKRDITVILNDNNYSIDSNVSALSEYFNTIFTTSFMQKMRENIWELTGKMDTFGDRLRKVAARLEGSVKAIITPGLLFEAMGFNYIGPINGHNVRKLVRVLRMIKESHGPILMHVITEKGKGYEPAEKDVYHLHAIEKKQNEPANPTEKPPKYQAVFGKAMQEIARENDKVVAITAAMAEGTGLECFAKNFPKRFFDVGIAESHAVTFASGLAIQGIVPVCAIYSSFLQRAFDQIAHDCALQNLHVVFAIDRAGIVGADGATHHGLLDIAFLRSIQNMTVMAPKDEHELRNMLYSAINFYSGPVSIRYPRGRALSHDEKPFEAVPYGKAELLRQGSDIAIIALGKMVSESVVAAEILHNRGISATVVNARFVKPLDEKMLDSIAKTHKKILTVEDGQALGGFGSAVVEYMAQKYKGIEYFIHGIYDEIIEHGTQHELLHDLKLDSEGIAEKAMDAINSSFHA